MKRFHVTLAAAVAVALLAFGACDFGDEGDTVTIVGPDDLMVALSLSMISSDCDAAEFTYDVSAVVLNSDGAGTAQFWLDDVTTKTASGPPYIVRHTWTRCGPDAAPAAGWGLRVVVTQSDGRHGEASLPFSPCAGCES